MKKVLFVNHDIMPYVAESELSVMGKMTPKSIQESGCEIRTFMPRWGNINERRGQLHEVIRLSGMNISINDVDHPVLIKVASITGTKVQVYFIDNDELFTKRAQTMDDNGQLYADNAERAIFYARSVVETIKKLRWIPEVIHCQGWFASFLPLFIKVAYQNEPAVCNAKIVTSLFSEMPKEPLQANIKDCLLFNEVTKEVLEKYNDTFDAFELAKIAIDYSDGVIAASDNIDSAILDYAKSSDAKFINYKEDDFAQEYISFYDSLFE